MLEQFAEIRYNLSEMAGKEANKLWRFARICEKHGVSNKTVQVIMEKAWWLHQTAKAYPERILDGDFKYKFNWAFQLGVH